MHYLYDKRHSTSYDNRHIETLLDNETMKKILPEHSSYSTDFSFKEDLYPDQNKHASSD